MISTLLAAVTVSWSVMHPTELDPDYMQRVADKAVQYGGVDSFEMCGRCGYAWGGINGILDYAPYPQTAASIDCKFMKLSRARLNKIVEIAHSVGKPIYYWHREGYMPKTLLKDILDYVIPGGIYDDCRVKRTAMHGSYQSVDSGIPVRFAGNPTFPNGTVTVEFKDIPGARVMVDLDCAEPYASDCQIVETVKNGVRKVAVSKKGVKYPAVRSIVLLKP